MTVYEKNLQAIKENQELLYEYLLNEEETDYGYRVEMKIAQNGEKYPVLLKGEEEWELNSAYNPTEAARIYAERYREIKPYEIYYIFGISDGRAVQEMVQRGDKSNVWVIYEPNRELFRRVIEEFDLTKLFENKCVCVTVDSSSRLIKAIEGVIDYNNRELLDNCILPNYDIIYTEKCKELIEGMIFSIQNSRVRINTVNTFKKEFAHSAVVGMRDALEQTNIYELKKRLEEEDLTGVPCIIVAAGPSLDKNIEELKRAKGKAFIIVVDAALRAMQRHGIQADMGVSVDARVPERFFEGVDMSSMPFLFEAISKPEIVQQSKGKHFYDGYPNNIFAAEAIKATGYHNASLKTGGSVSTIAFTLALYLEFKTIVFIGQDLAFTGGRSHNNNLGVGNKENEEYLKTRLIVQVEAVEGGMVETDYQMDIYRQWMEREIGVLPADVRVMNATEGGAKIRGTEVKTLKEVIDTECTRELDMQKILTEVPDAYNAEQKESMIKAICEKPKYLRELKEKVNEAEKVIEEIEGYVQKNRISGQKECLEKLDKLNQEIEDEQFKDILLYYNTEAEYGVGEDVFTADLSVMDLCQKARVWYAGYRNAIDRLIEDLEREFIQKYI